MPVVDQQGEISISATLIPQEIGSLNVSSTLSKTIFGSIQSQSTLLRADSGSVNISSSLQKKDIGSLNSSATLRANQTGRTRDSYWPEGYWGGGYWVQGYWPLTSSVSLPVFSTLQATQTGELGISAYISRDQGLIDISCTLEETDYNSISISAVLGIPYNSDSPLVTIVMGPFNSLPDQYGSSKAVSGIIIDFYPPQIDPDTIPTGAGYYKGITDFSGKAYILIRYKIEDPPWAWRATFPPGTYNKLQPDYIKIQHGLMPSLQGTI